MFRLPHVDCPPPGRRPLLARALVGGLLALCSCSHSLRPRGVLLVSIDSLRADHLSCYGYQSRTRPELATSPSIDWLLADQGALFEHVTSTTSWTLPAHMALLSGLADEEHGVRDLPDRLDPRHLLLAQTLQAAGWHTAGFWSGPNLHPFFGFDRGFERYVDCSSARVPDPSVFEVVDLGDLRDVRELNDSSHHGSTGPAVVEAFSQWFESLPQDEPFFAFLHLWDVHYDYTPPPEHDLFFPAYRGQVTGVDFRNLVLPQPTDPADVARLVSLYDGELHFTDANVARVLAAIDERGWLDETLVVLTADHGEEFLEHGKFGHRNSLYEEVLHVPLLLRWPARIPAGTRVRSLASLIDVAPTILDLCGLGQTRQAQSCSGTSLLPAIDGAPAAQRVLPLELTVRLAELEMRGARGQDYKIVREKPQGRLWVYDLRRDRLEQSRQSEEETAAPGQSDARFSSARELWAKIDARKLPDLDNHGGALPAGLSAELNKFGYTNSGDELPEQQR